MPSHTEPAPEWERWPHAPGGYEKAPMPGQSNRAGSKPSAVWCLYEYLQTISGSASESEQCLDQSERPFFTMQLTT